MNDELEDVAHSGSVHPALVQVKQHAEGNAENEHRQVADGERDQVNVGNAVHALVHGHCKDQQTIPNDADEDDDGEADAHEGHWRSLPSTELCRAVQHRAVC